MIPASCHSSICELVEKLSKGGCSVLVLFPSLPTHNLTQSHSTTMSLKGKVILITGGVLGECTAALLAKEGGTIALSYNSKPPKGTFGEGFKAFQADLRTEAGVESLFKAVKQAYGRVDIAINNSGKVLKKAIGEITEKVSTVISAAPVHFSTSTHKSSTDAPGGHKKLS